MPRKIIIPLGAGIVDTSNASRINQPSRVGNTIFSRGGKATVTTAGGGTTVPGGGSGGGVPPGGGSGAAGYARVTANAGLVTAVTGPVFRNVSTTDTMQDGDDVLICDTTSAGFTETLPSAIASQYKLVYLVNVGTNTLTISRAGTDVFADGATTITVPEQYSGVWLYCNGTAWYRMPRFYGKTTANFVLAGPTSGGADFAVMRALVAADVPSLLGDVTGSIAATTVVKIRNNNVIAGTPTDGQVFNYQTASTAWNASTIGGDVTGTIAAMTVVKLRGTTVATAAPTNSQVLTYLSSTSSWTPQVATGSGAVQAPASVVFDHADWVGATESITWRATNTTAQNSGAIIFYGWQTSPDNSTWSTEVFAGDTYQGAGITSGNQYARARAYSLGSTTPSGLVTSSVQAYGFARKWVVSFPQNGSTTGVDAQTTQVAPLDPSGNSVTWTPQQLTFRIETPSTGATAIQLIVSTVGNAVLGSGANLLSSTITQTGSSTYQTSSSSFTTSTVASGNKVACNWVAAGGTNAMVTIEFKAAF